MGDKGALGGPQFVNFRAQNPVRARGKERRHGDLLRAVTVDLVDTYQTCSNDFGYSLNHAPRRVLTKLSKGVHNQNYDNAEHDYICRVGDKIVNPDGLTYEILERLGHGTFGQVLKCLPSNGSQPIALKIIKNKPAYFHQALVEVRILQMLNQEFDPEDEKRIVRMQDFFVYRKHLCISFELLSVNLYEVLKQNSFRGVSMALIRVLSEQLLKAMRCLREASVIHCDLKPENVLLSNMHHTRIKLIDFGSACFESHTVYPYIQSRFYRSPEVLLGVAYTSAIDMWSLGCICAELFLGLPIFPGHSEYDQICRIVEVLNLPAASMLDVGRNTRKYFRKEEVVPESGGSGGDGGSGSGGDGQLDDQGLLSGNGDGHWLLPSGLPTSPMGCSRVEVALADAGSDDQSSGDELPTLAAAAAAASAEEASDTSPAEASVPRAEENESKPGSQSLHRSSSFLDLLKQRLGMQAPSDGMSNPMGAVPEATVGSESGAGATLVVSEAGCRSTGSASTAVDTSDGGGGGGSDPTIPTIPTIPRRRTISSEEQQEAAASHTTRAEKPRAAAAGGFVRRRRGHKGRGAQTVWRLKSKEEYERDEHKKEPTPKKYFNFDSLEKMIDLVPFRPNLSRRHLKEEQERRLSFLQFLTGLLQMNPDLRWTPKQASEHPFITGAPFDADWAPPPVDDPVPSFSLAAPPSRCNPPPAGGEAVPRLPQAAMGCLASAVDAAFSGGGSARTWDENVVRQGGGSSSGPEHPSSAPATTRGGQSGPMRNSGVDAAAVAAAMQGAATAGTGPSGAPAQQAPAVAAAAAAVLQSMGVRPDATGVFPDAALRGLWGHLCMGIPLPDDNPAESYRPPIDKMSESFFRTVMANQGREMHEGSEVSANAAGVNSPPKVRNGAWSASTGASFCSSASSSGSTPTGGRGRTRSAGSPLLTKGSLFAPSGDLRLTGLSRLTAGLSGTTVTPASSPHGSSASTAPPPHPSALQAGLVSSGSGFLSSGGGPRPGSGGTLGMPHTPHRGGTSSAGGHSLGGMGGSIHGHGRAMGSRDGSRGSSPWHLPSPMSELSTASDRLYSSQPSGSDSCPEQTAHCNFDECAYEDPSGQSDTPHWPRSTQLSDSDCPTPRSHDASGNGGGGGSGASTKDLQQALWDNIKYEMSRVELARDRIPRRLDVMQSPGSTGALGGNFREAVGMNENGPVIPFGHGAARRDAQSLSMRTPSTSSQPQLNDFELAGGPVTSPGGGLGQQPCAAGVVTAGGLQQPGSAVAQGPLAPGAVPGSFHPLPRTTGEGSLSHTQLTYHNHHHRRKGRRP